MADQRRTRRDRKSRRMARLVTWSLAMAAFMMLAACRSAPPPPSPSGGVYTSSTCHFRLTYPNGWQVNTPAGSTSSATVPLEIVITRIDAQAAGGAQVSTFTVVVFNAKDPNAQQQEIDPLLKREHASNSALQLKPVLIAGRTGYEDIPQTGTIPGTQVSVTHTDYYLLTSNFEYQISTDAVSGDNAASSLDAMLKSFTLLS